MDAHFAHAGLHIFTVLVAAVLFLIALAAWRREPKTRLLFVACAFGIYLLQQILVFLEVAILHSDAFEVFTHVLTTVIMIVFVIGILKK